MKTVSDLFKAFGKGQDAFRMSSKQGQWLLNVARKEGVVDADMGNAWYIRVDGKKYRVGKTYIPMACYGGGIGKKKESGNYNVQPVWA